VIVFDSTIAAKKQAILIPAQNLGWRVNMVLKNLDVTGTTTIVSGENDRPILTGSHVDEWSSGFRYSAKNPDGMVEDGPLKLDMPDGLLQNGKIFARNKPQYHDRPISDFIDVVRVFSVKNDGNPKDAEENRLRLRLVFAAAAASSMSGALRHAPLTMARQDCRLPGGYLHA
jgi:hypothetical protein